MNNIATLIKDPESTIVDVRTPGEFAGGHVAGSINIPLNEVPGRIDDLRSMKQIIVCCAAGGRSMQAAAILRQHGINCTDGGSWMNVNFYKNN